MDDIADTVDAVEVLLQEAEARALAILGETGFRDFIGGLESDEAWAALNAGKKGSDDPLSPGIRAWRATVCLLLVELIRAAAVDLDVDALIRHSVSLGQLDRDLLGHAERDAVIAVRNRLNGVAVSRKVRRLRRDEKREEWTAEARRHRSDEPGASDRAVAKHVAETCDAEFETVRKALRDSKPASTNPKK